MNFSIPVGVSNRHLHLSQEDLEKLFGKGYSLKAMKNLTQTGQFAAEETLTLQGPKGSIEKVRILGPVRPETQIEVSMTDSFKLGIKAPVRESGQIENTPGVTLIGPAGSVALEKGVIIASRHIHMHTSDAEKFQVSNGQVVAVASHGPRAIIFRNVVIRVRHDFVLDFHLDTDEANAAGLSNCDLVTVLSEDSGLPKQ
jgi:putative phosphotransacetylase